MILQASLEMYALPGLEDETEAWWRGLAGHFEAAGLQDVPAALGHGEETVSHWLSPDLLFSQTCGYPLTHHLAGKVRVVATPCYGAPGCAGPLYGSRVIVAAGSPARRMADLKGARAVISSPTSQSGFNCLRALAAPLAENGRFFRQVLTSGGHLNSIAMVAQDKADVAAIDCVTHALLATHAPERLAGTRVLCDTEKVPGLPYITALGLGADGLERLRGGLRAALDDAKLRPVRQALKLTGMEVLDEDAYQPILEMEKRARSLGYGEMG